MIVYEREVKIPAPSTGESLLAHVANQLKRQIKEDEILIRCVIPYSDAESYHCELGLIQGANKELLKQFQTIFTFRKRKVSPSTQFNVVLMVPTGIGAEIGGHAGDAGAVAKLLATLCDHLILHPNVVNASDINELPHNGLYIEGSSLSRLLMGTIGLRKVLSNRLLFVTEKSVDGVATRAAINALNASVATYGVDCPFILELIPAIETTISRTPSGRASGKIDHLDSLLEALQSYREQYDAVAISTQIDVPLEVSKEYFSGEGHQLNPWGGVEALFSHAISLLLNVPAAHAPMFYGEEEHKALYEDLLETVDPRIAAEWISNTFVQCILKGLQVSPRLVTDLEEMKLEGVLTAKDISCLVIPDHCLDLAILAALEQGITVIAVRENRNLMKNNLTRLPWAPGQFYLVDHYLEAAGLLSALKAGVAPGSVRRPLGKTEVRIHKKR